VGLFEDEGPHVLTQATWAIEVAKAVLLKLAREPQVGPDPPKVQHLLALNTAAPPVSRS
jgi:hypothetical protein